MDYKPWDKMSSFKFGGLWDNAGLVSINTGKLESYIKSMNAIWIPPDIDFEERNNELYAVYPVPNWMKVPSSGGFDITPQAINIRYYEDLQAAGWTFSTDTEGLLDDLIVLSNKSVEINSFIEQLQIFIKKWGILWKCQRHEFCYINAPYFLHSINNPMSSKACKYNFSDNVHDYVRIARRCKAAIDIAAHIQNNKPVPPQLWGVMGWKFEDTLSPEMERVMLCNAVNYYLSRSGSVDLHVNWCLKEKPQLCFETGVGFVNSAWLQVAQVLSKANNIYFCDGCNNPYIREGKRPKEGNKNFCNFCSVGSKASKRLSAKKQRNPSNDG